MWAAIGDPRPDLVEDTKAWATLIALAEKVNPVLAANLNGLRCLGTRLHQGKVQGRQAFVIRPDIDPDGKRAWASQEDYEQSKKEFLAPFGSELVPLLIEAYDQCSR